MLSRALTYSGTDYRKMLFNLYNAHMIFLTTTERSIMYNMIVLVRFECVASIDTFSFDRRKYPRSNVGNSYVYTVQNYKQ